MWAFLVLLLAARACFGVQATTLLFANVSGTGRYDGVQMSCASDEYNDAIAWITPLEKQFAKQIPEGSIRNITFDWRKSGWDPEFAYKASFGPITDYTWETLPIIMTEGAKLRTPFNFQSLAAVRVLSRFELNFSFLGESNAQIYWCDENDIENSACLTFIIGGWNGKGSLLRKCPKYATPIKYSDGKSKCVDLVNKVDHQMLFLKEQWSHITIKYESRILEAIVDGTTLFSFQTERDEEFRNYSHLFVHSYTENAFWKYHEYTFYETRFPPKNFIYSSSFTTESNQLLCISFLANFEEDITIKLLNTKNIILNITRYISDQNTKWNLKTFTTTLPLQSQRYILGIEFKPQTSVSIRNFAIHDNCNTNYWHSSTLAFNDVKSVPKIQCSTLQSKRNLAVQQPMPIDEDTQRYDDCSTNVCPHKMICNEDICYCSEGNQGNYCEKVTIINEVAISSDKVNITWDAPALPNEIITGYQIEWKLLDKRDCSLGNTNLEIQTKTVTSPMIEIKNLTPNAIYEIEIYSLTKTGEVYFSNHTAYTNLPAKFKNPAAIKHQTVWEMDKIVVNFQIDCSDWNGPFNVLLNLTCNSDWCVGDNWSATKLITFNDMSVSYTNLLPFTHYSVGISLQPKNKKFIEHSIDLDSLEGTTLPGVPNQVPFAEVYSKTETSLSLRWTAPYPPTGILDYFMVDYCYRARWTTCGEPDVLYLNNSCQIWPKMFCATIENLYTDHEYSVSIAGKNKYVYTLGKQIDLYEYTTISRPDPPLNLIGSWDDSRFLLLEWQHPNRTNGPHTRFDGKVNQMNLDYKLQENLTYYYNTTFQCTPKQHEATVTLKTINAKYDSPWITALFVCPVFKPSFLLDPSLTKITNNSLTIFLPQFNKNIETKSNLYIIILTNDPTQEGNCHNYEQEQPEQLDAITSIKTEQQVCWLIQKYNQTQYTSIASSEIQLRFQQMPTFNFETNRNEYEIGVLLVNEFNYTTAFNWYLLQKEIPSELYREQLERSESAQFNPWWLGGVAILVAVIVTGGFVYYKQPTWLTKWMFTPAPGIHSDINDSEPYLIPLTQKPKSVQQVLPTSATVGVSTPDAIRVSIAEEQEPLTKMVAVCEFTEYVKQAVNCGMLERQHKRFERGMLKAADAGKLENNYQKNRYKNLMAYDHTRIKLQCINGKPSSDYINANYIRSPICENAYIATQGPLDSTVYDFWHMIITEGVQHIIMLANLIETGKQKVSAYWPDHKKQNKTMTLDDITIIANNEKVFYNYTIRTFTVKSNQEEQIVTQLHFTSWPDHGVPLYPQSLLPFVDEILKIPHTSEHPILVHCSNGVRRTGTILLLDICLRQAFENHQTHIDPFGELSLLREQRPNLVDNIEQYKLVHLVLIEKFSKFTTTYSCEEFESIYQNLKDTELQKLLEYIQESAWQESAISRNIPSLLKIETEKNRDQEIIPEMCGVLYLRPQTESDSTYINAVTVDGFNDPKRFICTQHPLANTVDDFWRLVVDQEIKVIVSLQPEYDVQFWKKGGDLESNNKTLVEHLTDIVEEDLQVHVLDVTLQKSRRKQEEVHLIELNTWRVGEHLPEAEQMNVLLSLWAQVNKINLKQGKVLIMCRNGATASGLYLAMTNLLDRIQEEQVIDIGMTVRIIRRSRKQFVNNIEQLRALYHLVALYLRKFHTYANFTPKIHANEQIYAEIIS